MGLQLQDRRWYDPKTGRWTTEDPLGFGAGDANVNRYIGNSPPNGTDPSGEYLIAKNERAEDEWRNWLKEKGIRTAYAQSLPTSRGYAPRWCLRSQAYTAPTLHDSTNQRSKAVGV